MEETKDMNSIKQNAAEVEENIKELQANLRDYKHFVEITRAELVSMETNITLLTDDTPKSIFPQIDELFTDLKHEIQNQKDLNDYVQKQITGLKKEKSVLLQNVIASNTRCQILDENVGYR
ncbi:unnamed protein product [Blepharisma stoltei]|uniref:Uncharacterized protein n=1 Tax=Blepharisma stoltei TaxID=1481888 RepID=A0AAU9J6S7_9CILI|nr:unnamed protein product [Blepharisma stoltei]